MTYDGLGRRIKKVVAKRGDWDCTYHFYYDGHRMIETRNGSNDVLKSRRAGIWGHTYVDELVQIALNGDPSVDNDCLDADSDAQYYAAQDAKFNVTNLFESDGDLAERYAYTPYGQRTVFKSAGSDDDLCMGPLLSSQPHGACPDLIGSLCDVGHQGLLHDKETGLIHNRARALRPRLGRFLQRDPLGYTDGMSLYEYVGSVPVGLLDPSGRSSVWLSLHLHLQFHRVFVEGWKVSERLIDWVADVLLCNLGRTDYKGKIRKAAGGGNAAEKAIDRVAKSVGLKPEHYRTGRYVSQMWFYETIYERLRPSLEKKKPSRIEITVVRQRRTVIWTEINYLFAPPPWHKLYDWERNHPNKPDPKDFGKEQLDQPKVHLGYRESTRMRALENKYRGVGNIVGKHADEYRKLFTRKMGRAHTVVLKVTEWKDVE